MELKKSDKKPKTEAKPMTKEEAVKVFGTLVAVLAVIGGAYCAWSEYDENYTSQLTTPEALLTSARKEARRERYRQEVACFRLKMGEKFPNLKINLEAMADVSFLDRFVSDELTEKRAEIDSSVQKQSLSVLNECRLAVLHGEAFDASENPKRVRRKKRTKKQRK